jgi:predicted nucleic acid-binding protein
MSANIVVADAGPLHYLILVDSAEVLSRLFDHVLVPIAVRDELLHAKAPQKVKDWIGEARPWLEIVTVENIQPVHGLHRGETEALQLALERKAAAVLMDDTDGRAAAVRLGLVPIYTVALLERSAEKGYLDLPDTIARLRQTNFFIAPEILDAALKRDLLRREGTGG